MKALFFHSLRSRKKLVPSAVNESAANRRAEESYWAAVGGGIFVCLNTVRHDGEQRSTASLTASVVASQRGSTSARKPSYRICCRPRSFIDALSEAVADSCTSMTKTQQSLADLFGRLRTNDTAAPIEALLYRPIHRLLSASGHNVAAELSANQWPLVTEATWSYIAQTPFSLPVGQVWSTYPPLASRRKRHSRPSVASAAWVPNAGLLVAAWADLANSLRDVTQLSERAEDSPGPWGKSVYPIQPIRHIALYAPLCLPKHDSQRCPSFHSTLLRLQECRALWMRTTESSLALESYHLHLSTHLQILINQVAQGGYLPVLGSLHEDESLAAAAATLLLVNYVDRSRMTLPSRFRSMLLPHIRTRSPRQSSSLSAHLDLTRTLAFLNDPLPFVAQLRGRCLSGRLDVTPLTSPMKPPGRGSVRRTVSSNVRVKKERKAGSASRVSKPTKSVTRGEEAAPLAADSELSHSAIYISTDAHEELVASPGESLFVLPDDVPRETGHWTTVRMRMDDAGTHVQEGSVVFSYALNTHEKLQVRRHILGVTMTFAGASSSLGAAFDYCTGTMYNVEWDKWADLASYVVCGLDTALIQRRNMPATYSLSYNLTEVIVSAQHKIRARTTLSDMGPPEAIRVFVVLQVSGINGGKAVVRKYTSPPSAYQMHLHLMDTPWKGSPGKILFSEAFHCRKIGGKEAEAFINCIPHVEPLNGAIVPGSIVTIKTGSADEDEPVTPEPSHQTRMLEQQASATPPASHPKTRIDRIEIAQQIWSSLLADNGMPTCPWCQAPSFGNRYYHPRSDNDNKSLMASINRRNSNPPSHMSSKTLRAVNVAVLKMESGALGRLQKFRQSEAGIRGRN